MCLFRVTAWGNCVGIVRKTLSTLFQLSFRIAAPISVLAGVIAENRWAVEWETAEWERWFGGKGEKDWGTETDSHLWSCCAASSLHLISLDVVQRMPARRQTKRVCVGVLMRAFMCACMHAAVRIRVCVFCNSHLRSLNCQALFLYRSVYCSVYCTCCL